MNIRYHVDRGAVPRSSTILVTARTHLAPCLVGFCVGVVRVEHEQQQAACMGSVAVIHAD